jgi:DNA-binding MarR family transcriptional regulator
VPRDWHRVDLTMPQLKVLLSLFVDGPLPCSSLAEAVGVSLPTMNGVLERLRERGLIARRPDRHDRRRILNSLTARGHQLIEGLWTSGQDWLSELLDRMDSSDLETIEQALTIIVGALRRREQYAWTG